MGSGRGLIVLVNLKLEGAGSQISKLGSLKLILTNWILTKIFS